MYRKIIIAAGMLAALSGSALAAGSEAYVSQVGGYENGSSVVQAGGNQYANINQNYSSYNTSVVNQTQGGNGSLNTATVTQSDGAYNNVAYTTQNGGGLDSAISQAGEANSAEHIQTGNDHTAVTTQNGFSNSSYINQSGN
jgi:hypothetical protein